MDHKPLSTASEIVDALGGVGAVRELGYSDGQVRMWLTREGIPSEHFVAITNALRGVGKEADPKVFGMKETVNCTHVL
jgi:hypothetical protein